jgi:hypothetical protein
VPIELPGRFSDNPAKTLLKQGFAMIGAAEVTHLAARAPLGHGYRFELLNAADGAMLATRVREWYPAISVGGASHYTSEEFYAKQALFDDAATADFVVLTLRRGDELAGLYACEPDNKTQGIYASIGIVSPDHRGSNLAHAGICFTAELGTLLGMGFAYGMATLKTRYAQLAFERAGWQLIGITPGYDRELIEPGVVKRVYEAIYAKLLAPDASLLQPSRDNLTPRTQAFFDQIFGAAAG